MALFSIAFRIEYDAGYDKRYDSLVAAIKDHAAAGVYWDDPTSYFLLLSDLNSADLADTLVQNSHFDAAKDQLLVINLSLTKGHAARGSPVNKNLATLMNART